MPNEHERAVREAERTVDELGRLFAQIGTSEHPRGQVLAAYRTARQALQGNLGNRAAVEDALATLRAAVRQGLGTVLNDAADLGLAQAERELALYGLRIASVGAQTLTSDALQAALSVLEAQIQAVRSVSLARLEEAIALGDAGRVGVLTPGPVTREGSRWSALTALLAYSEMIGASLGQAGAGDEFQRQAVAAIDERTTQTCLLVHGQVVALDGKFKLTGTPRFADEMASPPFHWWCRTADALVRARDADDELSRQMRAAGQAELRAREETGTLVEIHPASGLSGR